MMNFTETKSHHYVNQLSRSIPHLRDLLNDHERTKKLVINGAYITADFTRQRVDQDILSSLFSMLDEIDFQTCRHNYFSGAKINNTEGRSVLHMAMRADQNDHYSIDNQNIMPDVMVKRQDMLKMAEAIRANKNIKNVVAIGIGGSDLGPRFVYDAFQDVIDGPQIHFVSNVDVYDLMRALKKCHINDTIFLITSKTFTTAETMLNAKTALKWAQGKINLFFAITSNAQKAEEWGIATNHILSFPEWVGGRFSLWSSIGFSIAIAFGSQSFLSLLDGARQCDQDFLKNEYQNNIPVMMALMGVYNRNYLKLQTHLISPYNARLRLISKYIQQMDMESNGKSVDRDGVRVNYETAPQIYGEAGTDCQHSYMQMIHQGSEIVPVDFIISLQNSENKDHDQMLFANMKGQANSLAIGQTFDEAKQDPFRVFDGNRPSTIFYLNNFDFKTIGYLIATYEHKIFTQGVLWNLNSYDQPGVELGKAIALKEMQAYG